MRKLPRQKIELQQYWFQITAGGIAILGLAYMIKHAGTQSFGCDELWQIGFELTTFKDALRWFYSSNHALFHFFEFFWYQIVPYGERWLILPSAIATAGGIYLTALCGARWRNQMVGIMACLLVGFSAVVMEQCGIQFRMYGFVFLFSALLLLMFLKHLQCLEQCKLSRELGIFGWMMALSLNHLLGFVFCGCLFLVDAVLCFFKKQKATCLIKYAALMVVYVPILVSTYIASETGWDTHSWMVTPGWSSVYEMLRYLAGDTQLGYVLLMCGIVFLVSKTIREQRKQGESVAKLVFEDIPLILMTLMMGGMFCFGIAARVFGLNGTLWVNRYFVGLIPCAALVISMLLDTAIDRVSALLGTKIKVEAVVILALCIVPWQLMRVYDDMMQMNEPYREAAEWLYEREDIFDPDTIVLSTSVPEVLLGWDEYYLTCQGEREAFQVLSQKEIQDSLEILLAYDRIYLQYTHFEVEEKTEEFLLENYTVMEENESLQIKCYTRK